MGRIQEPEIFIDWEDDGVVAEHGVISLDASSSVHVNFVSSAELALFGQKPTCRQLLVSEETHRMLAARFPKTNFLPCPFFRPIVLGNLSVELLPSGAGPGSSFLKLSKSSDSLFYAHAWSKKTSAAIRRAVTREAQTLLVRLQADPSQVLSTTSRRETDRFLGFCQKILAAGEHTVAVVDSFGEAQTLAARLTENHIPVSCDGKLFKLMKAMHDSLAPAQLPAWLRGLQRFSPSNRLPGVVLVSKEGLLSQRPRILPTGIWVWIGTEDPARRTRPWLDYLSFSESFAIQDSPDMAELSELVHEVRPKHVLLFGPGAPTSAHHLARQGVSAEVFAPPKIETLF